MFSPSAQEGGPAMATRSRRRQRPLSSEHMVQPPKAKRQRLPLTEQTFVNPDATPETFEVKADKASTLDLRQDGFGLESQPVPKKELSVRAKRPKHVERTAKGDGSVVLTTNNAYTISKLPALPDRIHADATGQQHSEIYSNGYALALTHTHAVVWPYTSPTQSPEAFTFTLPYPSKHVTDPLPLGCLVSASAASSEPGLVVVMPVTGKITYWESISSAATLDFMRQQRHGIEGSIPGLFSGEKVVQIANAESAGFILTFTSGRLAYMSVRDGHGRPLVSVQFLRTNITSTTGGIFGSIRHALAPSTGRGEIAAVRADRSSRIGERNIVAATLKGKLYAWRIHRGGHSDSITEADVGEQITEAIREVDPKTATGYHSDAFEVVDFTYVPQGIESKYQELSRLSDAMASDDVNLQHLLLLISLSKRKESHYFLVEVILSPSSARIGMVRPITSYRSRLAPASSDLAARPRLHLPRPALVAFVIFDKAVVIASIACPPESPDAQLQEDSHMIPATYEDVVTLSDNKVAEIVGSGFEEPYAVENTLEDPRSIRHKSKNPSAVFLVRGTGILRLTTTDIDRFASDKPPKVDARSKLEQAVFFGNKQDTPLHFGSQRGVQFSHDEMAEAALQLSREILSSSLSHISTVPASLEDNLRSRAAALERLMYHLKAMKVQLDRRTRWVLLSHAEKMMASTMLWKQHEAFTHERPASNKKDLMSEIVEFIHQSEKKVPNRDVGEVDRVRHWFIHDVGNLHIFVAWAYEVIKYMYKDHILDDVHITRLIHEAVQVNLIALNTALEYRMEKLAFYGLQNEDLEFGILRSDYQDLPEFWTSSSFITNNLKRLLELCHQWLDQYSPPKEGPKQPDPQLIEKIKGEVGPLTNCYLLALLEQSRWSATRQDEKSAQWAEECAKLYATDKYDKILSLLRLGKWDESVHIAEKHRSWKALAVSLIEQVHGLRKELELVASPSDIASLTAKADLKEAQIGKYFDKYGEPFAFPAYEILLESGSVQSLLDFPYDRHGYKTRFLRKRPELARISWINDILEEKDVGQAAETLLDLGLNREQQVWCKKIELSLAKLSLMAEAATDQPPKSGLFGPSRRADGSIRAKDEEKQEEQMDMIDKELSIIQIQKDLFSHIYPTITTAVDNTAALQLVMETHCLNIPRKQKTLAQVFENGMRRLIHHEALDPWTLIDLLTLVAIKPDTAADTQDPFYLALRVAKLGLKGEDVSMAERLIWRRCFIRDDWLKLNDTQFKDDAEVEEMLSETTLFSAMLSCYHGQTVEEPFQPLRPSVALGVFVDSLDRRFNDMDKSFRDKFSEAMKWEDSVLSKYIEKARLEKWSREAAENAQAMIVELVDEQTKAGAAANRDMPASDEDVDPQQLNGKANGQAQ
ncbi:hypothetical protein ACRALDRAFT_2058231 [Sodiomyces alcalophilus JCM 7366]|uniref:uncharacterized protein n=1 Tax=Sodiomyces alcalophilus JCM 7366 TaxID=591952 RepID=UPI0039B4CE4A